MPVIPFQKLQSDSKHREIDNVVFCCHFEIWVWPLFVKVVPVSQNSKAARAVDQLNHTVWGAYFVVNLKIMGCFAVGDTAAVFCCRARVGPGQGIYVD